MNELIKIETSTDGIQTVNARDLHVFLGVGKVFAAWIQDRIDQYGFEQGKDYEVFSDSGNKPQGGRPSKEYAISIDMAKELAMVERNDKGREARQYFIECERRAKNPLEVVDPRTKALIESLVRVDAIEQEQKRLADRNEQLERRLDQIETAQDHFTVIGYNSLNGHGSMPVKEAARLGKIAARYCKDHDIAMGEVPDPRFGTVKTYPKWVLEMVFAEDVLV